MGLSEKSASIKKESSAFEFLLWILWVAIATLILGGAVYLFVGGSHLFTKQNTEPLIVYREVSDGLVGLRGTLMLPTLCDRLEIETKGTAEEQRIYLSFIRADGCDKAKEGTQLPETFFTEFTGGTSTKIITIVDGEERETLIK